MSDWDLVSDRVWDEPDTILWTTVRNIISREVYQRLAHGSRSTWRNYPDFPLVDFGTNPGDLLEMMHEDVWALLSSRLTET